MFVQRTDGTTVNAGDIIVKRVDGSKWKYGSIVSAPDYVTLPGFAGKIQVVSTLDATVELAYPPEFDLTIIDY